MNAVYWRKTILGQASYGVLLFLSAGRIDWLEGWIFFVAMLLLNLALLPVLAKSPHLLEERFRSAFQEGQETWDKVFFVFFIPSMLLWLWISGVDAGRIQWSYVPWGWKAAGGGMLATAYYIFYRVFRENAYAAVVVKLQEKAGQRVITTGPYAIVRHPMYVGSLLMFPGGALMLGSWFGAIWSGLIAVMFIVRTALEDRMLRKELDGYAEYAQRVLYRLIPFIW